ncbi:hypothetical protein Q5762_17355, partial [Streptomyces sp. P9(2023)]|nr:hypothetical protein [Streptomyces sp. P9(2023)]
AEKPMKDFETQNVGTWTTYGAHQLARDIELPELDGWVWDVPEAGFGAVGTVWQYGHSVVLAAVRR